MEPLKIDLGCGPNKRPGFIGVDRLPFDGKVDVVCDLVERETITCGIDSDNRPLVETYFKKWPWDNDTVDEAHSSHFIEHLTAWQRVHFCNELYRVLKPGAGCFVAVPHWGSCRAYGDPTHQWPPVSEFWFYYLSKDWRAANAPHTDAANVPNGFSCDFECTWGYTTHPQIALKNQEAQQFAFGFYKEAIQDIHATLKKKV